MSYEHELQWQREEKPYTLPMPSPPKEYPVSESQLVPYMRAYLTKRELSSSMAFVHGWYPAYHNGPRIIIPCDRSDGEVFWQGRLIDGAPSMEVGELKRWDSPHGSRGDAICILPSLNKKCKYLGVVEGPMDALALLDAGSGVGAIALLGLTPPKAVWRRLGNIICYLQRVHGLGEVICFADADQVPQWVHNMDRIKSHCDPHTRVKLVIPTLTKDVAAMKRDERSQFLHHHMPQAGD